MKRLIPFLILLLAPLAHAQQMQIYCNAANQTPCNTIASPGLSQQGDPAWLFAGKVNANFDTVMAPYARTAAEIAAGVTPVNYGYPPGDARRYGAVGNCIADDTAALQNDINASQIANIPVELAPGACYYTASGLVFKQGKSATDSQSYAVYLEGNGATLEPAAGVSAITITPRCLLSDVGTGRANAPIIIDNLIIDGTKAGSSASQALLIGRAGYRWDSFTWDKFSNITVQNFQNAPSAVMLWEGRHAAFDRLSLKTGASLFIQGTTSGSFVGDFVFIASDFTGSGTQPPITISANNGAQARGIKFIGDDVYGGGSLLHATGTGGSQVGDIWFTDVQFDGASGTDVFLTLYADTASAQLFDVHINHDYFVNGTQALYIHTANSPTMKGIDIGNNWFNTMNVASALENSVVLLLNANGVSIHGDTFDAVTGASGPVGQYVAADTSTDFSVSDETATNCTNIAYGVATANASTRYSILGNMMCATTAAVNNGATGTPVDQLANNLAVTQ